MRLDENIHRIKEVMGLITEEEEASNGVEINLGNLFDSGKYKLSPQATSSVNEAILKLRTFAKKNPGKPVLVTVESSESKVPNYDREKYPVTGDKQKDFTPEKRMAVGALSSLRAQTLNEYLTKNLRIPTAKIVVNNKGAQGPAWDGKYGPNNEMYTKNQYVKLFAKLNTTQPATDTKTTQTDPKVCNQEIGSSGGKGNPKNGFISEVKTIDLGETLDTFTFLLDSKNVPDLMIVEYNGKTQTTGFIGSDTELYQTLIGTIIYNYYDNWGNPRPWWFKDLKLVGVQPYHADQVLKRDAGQWKPDDYSHIWPTRPPLGGNFFQDEFKKGEGFYPKKLDYGNIKIMGAGVNAWDSPAAIKIQKVPGVNTAKVTIVGLIGQTQWKLYVKCGKPEALITNKGTTGGDV